MDVVDNRVQVLKSVPVNLSLNTEQHQEAKREQFTNSTVSSTGPGAVVKAEAYAPAFTTTAPGHHYRLEGEESARVIYEQSPYEVTNVSHSSYAKDDQQSPPDSPYEEDRDGVRGDARRWRWR